eukprot:GILK01014571.1.p1 GENE.GILK01014571.1~~GILK01014571.1.p1  ORF type:complete len:390 (+),score=27.85 GILK01014571.1:818-1987(+)
MGVPDEDIVVQNPVSQGFIYRWAGRNKVVIKTVKKQSKLTPDVLNEKAQGFYNHLHRMIPNVDAVINFDEIPTSISGLMGTCKTVTTQDDTQVQINSDPNDTKRMATLIPIVGAKKVFDKETQSNKWVGFYVGVVLLFAGQPQQSRVTQECYYQGVTVAWSKCGVMTQEVMFNVIAPLIKRACNREEIGTCITILDSAKSHVTPAVLDKLYSQRTPACVIPAGMTSWVQWVDVFFAAKYRAAHDRQYAPFRTIKKTASEKRRLMTFVIGSVMPILVKDVVAQFEKCGYLNPQNVQIRELKGFSFVPPSAQLTQEDKAQMERRVVAASAAFEGEPLMKHHRTEVQKVEKAGAPAAEKKKPGPKPRQPPPPPKTNLFSTYGFFVKPVVKEE